MNPVSTSWLHHLALATALLLAGCSSTHLYTGDGTQKKLWVLNKSTAAAQAVGSIGHDLDALACSETVGKLYGSAYDLSPPYSSTLFAINATTGAATVIGEIPNATVTGLAYDSGHDKLYGITLNELLLINPSNAQAVSVGSPGIHDFYSLAFYPVTNMLYSVRRANKYLYRIDPQTGTATPVGPTGTQDVDGLGYDGKTFTLFGIRRSAADLIEINIQTGAGSEVGSLPNTTFKAMDACVS
jgi:hypothetical protein